MPLIDFKCMKCGYIDEFIIGPTVSEQPPKNCKKCNGKMEQQLSVSNISSDVVGGYDYQYGKKSWTKQSPEKRAEYLVPDAAGRYKNPY